MPPTPQFRTRKPTGKPSWPSCLLAGIDHAGKSLAAATASASDLIGRTFWIEYGESTADAYGAVPDARYEIVEHDGSYLNVLGAVRWASEQPRENPSKPNLIVFDSGSELWATLSEEQAIIARARRKKSEAEDVVITPDQWNLATTRWNKVIAVLRKHDGPTILTARLDEVMVLDRNGSPTKDKTWKVQAQKRTPFALDMTIQMRAHRTFLLTGSRSLALTIPEGADGIPMPGFTFDGLWKRIGLDQEGAVAHRQIVEGDAAAGVAELESAAAAAAGDDEGHGPAPMPEAIVGMVGDIVQNAKEQPEVALKALRLIRQQHGDEVLRQVGPCQTKAGPVSALTFIEQAHAYVAALPKPEPDTTPAGQAQDPSPEQHAAEVGARLIEQGEQANAQARADADARQEPDAPADTQPDAPVDAPVDAPAEKPAAKPKRAARAAAPTQDARAGWLDELTVHAQAKQQPVEQYVASLLAHRDSKSIDEVPEKVLAAWLASQRPPIAGALQALGQQTAAERLRKANRNQPATRALLFEQQDETARETQPA